MWYDLNFFSHVSDLKLQLGYIIYWFINNVNEIFSYINWTNMFSVKKNYKI